MTSTSASTRSGGIFDVDGKQDRLLDLERQASSGEFWADQAHAQAVLKQKSGLERTVRQWQRLRSSADDVQAMLELAAESSQDEAAELLAEASSSLRSLSEAVRTQEIERLLGDDGDDNDAILEINAGNGGTDASDWAEMLKRMYLRWAERRGFKTRLVDEQPAEEAGIKSCTLAIQGDYAYGYLRSEIGVHRLVRISPFDANARRQTSFASVAAYPDVDDSIEIDLKESDLRIDVFRSSGAGGQSVNTTDSAVRLTHLPTGIVVQCQNERSQHKNKATAMKLLRGKLYKYELEKRQELIDAANAEKKRASFGSQIRNYVLHPYRMVKDTRTGTETGDADAVLDGALNPYMESWLAAKADGSLGEGEDVGA